MAQQTIHAAIIGLNRFTGSIALALREYVKQPNSKLNFEFVGYDEDKDIMKTAQQNGVVNSTNGNLRAVVKDADFVLASQAPDELLFSYGVFGERLKPGAVVLDMSFNKVDISTLAQEYFPKVDEKLQAYLISIHPLVHNDFLFEPKQGIATANANLFKNSDMIIAPDAACPEEAVKLAADLTDILNMKPRFLAPDEYRALVSYTENLPVLLSFALFGAVTGGSKDLERTINPTFAMLTQSLRYFNGKDLSALFQQNKDATLNHINSLISMLVAMRDQLAQDDPTSFDSLSEEIAWSYENWESRRLTGEWEKSIMPNTSALRSSIFGGLFGMRGADEAVGKVESKQTFRSSRFRE